MSSCAHEAGKWEASDSNECIAQENQKQSPFLRLPAELRNKIYRFAFRTMVLRVLPKQGSLAVLSNAQDLALVCSCRQIRHEALSLFFQLAEFRVLQFDDLYRFANYLEPETRSVVRSISMWWTDFEYEIRLQVLQGRQPPKARPFPDVEEIIVRGFEKYHRGNSREMPRSLKVPMHSPQGEIAYVFQS